MSTIAKFEINYSQFLDHHGEITQDLPDFAQSKNTLIELYRVMKQVRAYDTKAIALQRTGKMGTYPSIHGQEAISTAIGHAMRADDVFVPYYRDQAAQLQRGVKMSDIYRYWGGDERGSDFANPHDFPISVPIASQCLHAVGIASAFKLRKQDRVAVVSIGDGGTSEGDFYEAINVAGDWSLPVVFVINNNQWAISVPRNIQSAAETLAQKAIAAGIPGEQVDGNDVIAVYHAVNNALARARRAEGACVIEAMTYRLCDHTTADDATRYRSKEEFAAAEKKEPIVRLRKYLEKIKAWSADDEQKLDEECARNVQIAVDEYLNMPPQKIESIFDFHYAQLPDALIEQRQEAIEGAH